MDRVFPLLLSLLSDTCDDVLLLDLQLLSDICEGKNTSGVELQELNLGEDTLKQVFYILFWWTWWTCFCFY